MAYRQPAVNGELVETIIRTASGPIILAGSKLFFQRFAADLVALVGTPEAPVKPKPGRPSAMKGGDKRVRVTAARLAAIEIACAHVAAGKVTHREAAASLGLTRSALTSWVFRLEEARRLGRPIFAIG